MKNLAYALPLAFLFACEKPEPPKVVPKEARVVAVGIQGLQVDVKVEVTNVNKSALTVQSVTGKAKVMGQYDMGTVTVNKPTTLPPNTPVVIEVPLMMPWKEPNPALINTLAATQKPIPYSVEGTAKIGGERLNIDVPFIITGTITKEQIGGAVIRSIPGFP